MAAIDFGLNIATSASPGRDPIAEAQRAEDLGFDFISSNDHPCGDSPIFETWTLLTWIAASTSRIRIATRVLGVPYRAPAMVAKMAESLDRLSGGRLILGMGGGGADDEFKAFGLNVPSAREKVEGLEEAVRIVRGLWTEETFTFDGRHHHTLDAQIEPKPEHEIPIWLGTFGPRALEVTGRVADGWIPSFDMAPPEDIPAMRDRIFTAARAAGRDPDRFTCAYNLQVRVDDATPSRPGVVSGSAGAVTEAFAGFAALGFSALNLIPMGPDKDEQVERIAKEVLPALR